MNRKKEKMIYEYLSQKKQNTLSSFSFLDFSRFEYSTLYGFIENKIAISDNESFYLLYESFSHRKRIYKNSIYLPNIDNLYQDILYYLIDRDYLSTIKLEDLYFKFYQEFLGENVENLYDNKNQILVAKSDLGEGFVYTKKRNSIIYL